VPVLIAGEPHGNLYLTGKQAGAEFTADHEEAVGLPAKFAGVASDHAQRSPGSGKRRVERWGVRSCSTETLIVGRSASAPVP
jgi:hypothetical protein